MAYDTYSRLNERESMRLQNELKKRGIDAKLRELRMYTPDEISANVGISAPDIARMAGRQNEQIGAPRA